MLLGHTLDDQAETVLLGLGRGSGAAVAGRHADLGPAVAAPAARGCAAPTPAAACAAQGLPVWDDPHNADPRFTRVRLRHEVLPLLEEVLGGGVAEALARTAAQLREDGEALDAAAPTCSRWRTGTRRTRTGRADSRRDALDADAARRRARRGAPPGAAGLAAAPRRDRAHRRSTCAPPTTSSAAGADRGGGRAAGRLELVREHGRLSRAHGGVAGAVSPPGRVTARPDPRRTPPCTTVTSRPCWSPRTRSARRPPSSPRQIGKDYADRCAGGRTDLLLVGVLKGAVMFMTDLARALPLPVQLEFMAVSSYGSATSSSGVVRILKDLDRDIAGRHVLIVEDIIDSGLTLSWLLKNLESRQPGVAGRCARCCASRTR